MRPKTKIELRLIPLVVVTVLALAPERVSAGAAMRLVGPAHVVGDGTTPIQLQLSRSRAFPAKAERKIKVTIKAGRVTSVQRSDNGELSITWVPPRLAFARKVVVRVRYGRRSRATYVVRVTPFKRQPVRAISVGAARLEAASTSVLGRDKSLVIKLQRVNGKLPRLHVNVGTLSPVRSTSGSAAETTYTLPTQQFPQIAIVVATNDRGQPIDWLAIRLFGQAQISMKTEPAAMVTVQVDSERYGPVRADRKGRATVGILAPPGLSAVQTFARDRLGNTRSKKISLGAPPFSRATAICPADADRVFAVVVDRHGKAVPAESVAVTAQGASMAAPTVLRAGVVRSLVTVADTARLGDRIKVSAAPFEQPAAGGTCEVSVHGGPLAKMVVTTSTAARVAGSASPVTVRIALLAATGKPAQPSLPTLSVDFGRVGPLRLTAGAVYEAAWTLPNNFSGRMQATVSAQTASIKAQAVVMRLVAGPIATINATAQRTSLAATVKHSTTIEVGAVDAHGNPAPVASVSASAKGLLRRRIKSASALQLTYTAVASDTQLIDTVTIRDRLTGAQVLLPITLTPHLGTVALTAEAGFMTDFSHINGATVSVNAQVRTALLKGRASARLQVGFARAHSSEPALMLTNETVSQTVSLVPMLAGAYVDILTVPVVVYAGLSVGAVYTAVGLESETTGHVVNTSWSYGFAGAVGAHYPFGLGHVNVELSHLRANVDASPIVELIGLSQLVVGYRLRF